MVIAGFIIIVFVLLKSDFIGILKGKPKEVIFNFGDIEDIKSIDFESRIKTAVAGNDLRLAIRWYYLKQLNVLNTKSFISWQSFKTNIDYAKELKQLPFVNDFKAISKIYDYVWYGQYNVVKENYVELEKKFKEFENKIN